MSRIITLILLFAIFITGCETRGDKFPGFNARETILGKILNHEIKKASFLNVKSGFAAISKDTILKTDDSCKTFSFSLSDRSASFEKIQMVNDSVCFVIDRNNKIYRTLDGGQSWARSYISVPGAYLLDLLCINKDTVFIAAGGNPKSQTGYILRSIDGGKTWETSTTINLMNIDFVDNSTGFASGYGGMIRTIDCGKTWDSVCSVPAYDVLFSDPDHGYMSAGRSIYITGDGGKKWKLVKKIINPHWILGEDFSKIEGLSQLHDHDLIFTLNSKLIKVAPDLKFYQYEFTRPYYQLQMLGRDKGIVYGFENLILVQF